MDEERAAQIKGIVCRLLAIDNERRRLYEEASILGVPGDVLRALATIRGGRHIIVPRTHRRAREILELEKLTR